MANRAYLYSTATAEQFKHNWTGDDDNPYEDAFFDSRWNIPVTWWFLFAPHNIFLIDVQNWKEIRLQSKKTTALERFLIRRPRLELILENRIDYRHVDYFVRLISDWPGEYIVLDANAIVQGDDELEAQRISKMLPHIDDDPFDSNLFLQLVDPLCWPRIHFDDKWSLSHHLVGAAYGETAHHAFKEIIGSA